MNISRKKFLQLGLRGIMIISASNAMETVAGDIFRLPAKNKIARRFVLASDGHYGEPGTDFDYFHGNMIRWLNEEKRKRGLDFAVINGDLFHNNPAFLPLVKKKWDALTMPYYVSHGNHDMIDEAGWKNNWGTGWHHSFETDEAGFIILNTADDHGTYICPDLEWTKKAFERFGSKRNVFVFMHITPVKWTRFGIECPELLAVFDQYPNLKAIFHGHDHDQDDVKVYRGKHYFFDSHLGGSWGTEYHGYRIVELLDDGRILSYQMNAAGMQEMNRHRLG